MKPWAGSDTERRDVDDHQNVLFDRLEIFWLVVEAGPLASLSTLGRLEAFYISGRTRKRSDRREYLLYMTRKANREKKHIARKTPIDRKELEREVGPKQPIRIFGCPDCELLIIEYPDVDSISCPWCRRQIDVYASYSYVAFASGVTFSKTFDGQAVFLE